VLLMVAVMATIAATAMDRIGIATRLGQNAGEAAQARAWLGMAERLAAVRVEDLLSADSGQTTLKGNWMGVERSINLPNATVTASLADGGNCFNLNSLVEQSSTGALIARPRGREQFVGLMAILGVPRGEADRIASAATDYIDTDTLAVTAGAEMGVPNDLMIDHSELRGATGLDARHYRVLERWVCALPTADLSPINVNTLLPEQAPLLAMLAPDRIDMPRARAALAQRPVEGFGSLINFWNSPAMRGLDPTPEIASQARMKSSFFTLRSSVTSGRLDMAQSALLDARTAPVRVVHRQPRIVS
jgi:general secretion pathway protein K